MHGQYDITAGDYVTYTKDQLGIGVPKADLRIIAESSFLQPNVLTLLTKGGSEIAPSASSRQGRLGQCAERHRHLAGRLSPHRAWTQARAGALRQRAVPGGSADAHASEDLRRRVFAPEPFVSFGEEQAGLQELADLDQGATQDFPIQGYAVTARWARSIPTRSGVHARPCLRASRSPTPTVPRWKQLSRSTWASRRTRPPSSRSRAFRSAWTRSGSSAW